MQGENLHDRTYAFPNFDYKARKKERMHNTRDFHFFFCFHLIFLNFNLFFARDMKKLYFVLTLFFILSLFTCPYLTISFASKLL